MNNTGQQSEKAAALRIVDESGVGALSMRSLAASLGTGPMTLYNYVADKEGLEELVVAAIVAEVRLPEPTDDWQQDAYAIAGAMWQGIRAHPAAIPLVLTRRMSSSTGFAAAEALIVALGRAGLEDRDRLAAFHALLGLVTGAAQADLAGPRSPPASGRSPAPTPPRGGVVDGSRRNVGGRGLRPRPANAARRHRHSTPNASPPLTDRVAGLPLRWPRSCSWPR